jgi:hypothetical protein
VWVVFQLVMGPDRLDVRYVLSGRIPKTSCKVSSSTSSTRAIRIRTLQSPRSPNQPKKNDNEEKEQRTKRRTRAGRNPLKAQQRPKTEVVGACSPQKSNNDTKVSSRAELVVFLMEC